MSALNASAKLQDSRYIFRNSAYLSAPFDENGVGTMTIPCMYGDPDDASQYAQFTITREECMYNLSPSHLHGRILFHNPSDLAYYQRVLPAPKLIIWILTSSEIPKSYTAKRFWEVGWRKNLQIRFMNPDKFELIASKESMDKVFYQGKEQVNPDCVIARLGAKVSYMGLCVLRQLSAMGFLILNNAESLEVTKDKWHTMQVLAGSSVPIPKSMCLTFPLKKELIEREFDFPIILKLASGSQGTGVMKIESPDILVDMSDMLAQEKTLLIQEFISNSSGMDVRAYVVGGKLIGAMMRKAQKGFKANVHQGASVSAIEITPQMEWLASEAVSLVGLDIAGVDLLIDRDSYKVCEINSSPGIEGFERATGVSVPHLTLEYVKVRCGVAKVRKVRNRDPTSLLQFDSQKQKE